MTRWSGCAAAAFLAVTLLAVGPVEAQEYRAFWVDTFNTALNNHNDVVAVVNNAKAANANAILAQVRRRGDSWYLNSLEPPPDPNPIQAGFDPLADLISVAHAEGIEVHAFVIVGAVWNRNPVVLTPPASPDHVFNRHGGFDASTGRIVPGPDNWLTRTLIPDGTAAITFQGHRVGAEFWIEPGHPDAAADTVDVLMHLVRNYDVDGLHLDRIRYPEIAIAGQTPTTGTNIGYNVTNLARFKRHFGLEAGPDPTPGNPAWMQWRRDQVTNLVRRIYLNAIAAKPHLKISAALIAFGGGPTTEAAWNNAEAYWRVYQDWRAWTEEGIIDLAMPMDYKREHVTAQQTQFNQWLEWTRHHQYNRAALIGQGAFLNSIEGTLPQVRRSLDPAAPNPLAGVVFFSMATSNVAVTNNPFALPVPATTPARPFAEFASGLTTGRSSSGFTLFEDPTNPPVFNAPAHVPVLPWKINPQVGHIKGFVKDETGAVVDTGAIAIQRQGTDMPSAGRAQVTNATDGGGFYGGVDLAAGTYRVTVTPLGAAPFTSCPAVVTRGAVTTLDVTIDRAAPATTITADPQEIWPASQKRADAQAREGGPPDGRTVMVTVSGNATDAGTGIASIAFRVLDEYGEVVPVVASESGAGAVALSWSRQVELQALRRGEDRDGRTYTIEATITDNACNTTVVTTTVLVGHDQRRGGQAGAPTVRFLHGGVE